ncbi:MAG: hypothetical protein JWQ95_460, partial [Sphaerisporangium sp.]|nr:hypothetical protein [Sphaerisporangium sp.]
MSSGDGAGLWRGGRSCFCVEGQGSVDDVGQVPFEDSQA